MATAEELLAAAGVVDETLTIDLDTRVITIPKTVYNLGVESDDDTKVLHFTVPRMYKQIDLSLFEIRVNYTNAEKLTDIYVVDDVETTDDGMLTFTWTVGRFAYTKDGTVEFNICFKLVDTDNIVKKEINTAVATLNVLRGKEGSEAVIQQHPDIIEQLVHRTEEQIRSAVNEYFDEDPEAIGDVINAYLKEHPLGAGGATEEEVAQIHKNKDDIASNANEIEDLATYVENLPFKVDPYGYAEVSGLRKATAIRVTKNDLTITVETALEGDKTIINDIVLNADLYPISVTTDGTECPVTWEGFDG